VSEPSQIQTTAEDTLIYGCWYGDALETMFIECVSVEGMLTDLLFVRRFFNVVLMLLAQLDLHPPVQLYQFLLIRLELRQKTAQALMKFHFTSCLGFNRILSRQQVQTMVPG